MIFIHLPFQQSIINHLFIKIYFKLMKKLKEILKTNSSFSSKLDIFLENSLYGDLSFENIKEDNNQDIKDMKIEKQ